jgi:hypothetical protein
MGMKNTQVQAKRSRVGNALVFLGLLPVVMAGCGSQAAKAYAARPAPKAISAHVVLTASDRAAEHAFASVDWNAISYPGIAPHCHPVSGGVPKQSGNVVAYLVGSQPIAIVAGSCASTVAEEPTGIYAFLPPTGTNEPRLQSTLVPVPASPLERDNPSSIFFFENAVAGKKLVPAIPSPAGTTTRDPLTIAGPVLKQIECYPSSPLFTSNREITLVGETNPVLQVPDNPPASVEDLTFRLSGSGTWHMIARKIMPVKRYSCP